MRAASCTLALVLLASCGGRAPVVDEAPVQLPQQRSIGLPDPVPAIPLFLATLERPIDERRLAALARIRPVAVVAPLSKARVRVSGPSRDRSMTVAAVDPVRFRPVAPPPTRDADFVWTWLLQGEAVVTPAAARRLDLDGAERVQIDGSKDLGIGAFADNGTPNLADMLVGQQLDRALGLGPPRTVVIGVKPDARFDPRGLRSKLRRRLPNARIEQLTYQDTAAEQAAHPVESDQSGGAVIGAMSFRILRSGYIDPDPAWVSANIASAQVPILGTVTCHRIVFPQLAAALGEIHERGLGGLIDPGGYGGCYVPRFIDRDPRRALSMHAFGLAFDINVGDNALGTRGNMDPRIVEVFERWGFEWGGRWARPDPMHFELARILRT